MNVVSTGGVSTAYEDGTECSETSAYNIHTPENHPKETIQNVILIYDIIPH
jgi:hypothetical protein